MRRVLLERATGDVRCISRRTFSISASERLGMNVVPAGEVAEQIDACALLPLPAWPVDRLAMSAVIPKADMCGATSDVR
jgi:hypothetical protein